MAKSVIIIGVGIAGLSAGCYAKMMLYSNQSVNVIQGAVAYIVCSWPA